jgi:glycolate oxidase
MALSRDAYKEFEDVVGAENISDDPVILDAYQWPPDVTPILAVVLPKDTGEIQAIVKLCNKHKIKVMAAATGWTLFGTLPPSGVLYLDLRRMNHIIEINEKNMYAVVEPYIISAQLQAELMKRGMNCDIKGSGSNCTANPLAGLPHGHMDQNTSVGYRNVLAAEWVTPEGEIVRMGSLGSADEWFCGDGPGPSLRGIVLAGGVYTKIAMKVYHWPGPARFPIVGSSPYYALSRTPPGMMVRYYSFPSIDEQFEAECKINESEISFELMCFNIAMVSSNISRSNEEELETFKRLSKQVQGPGFMVIIAGNSPEDFEYKQRVLEQIIKETGGKSLEPIEDPEIGDRLLFQCTRITASIRETFRAGGLFSTVVSEGQRDLHIKWLKVAEEAKRALISKGLVVDDGGYQFGWSREHGHAGHTEIFCRHSVDPEPVKAVREWQKEQNERGLDGCFSVPIFFPLDVTGPRASNFHIWLRKVMKALDPNNVSPTMFGN